MPGPEELGHLRTADWGKFQELADRFEQAWQQASGPRASVELKDFLPPGDDPLRVPILHELIKIDLEVRWRRGHQITIERYLEQFPELGSARTLDVKLLYEEYRVRQLYGDRPNFAIYQNRFPDQYEELRKLSQGLSMPMVTPVIPLARDRSALSTIGPDAAGFFLPQDTPAPSPVPSPALPRQATPTPISPATAVTLPPDRHPVSTLGSPPAGLPPTPPRTIASSPLGIVPSIPRSAPTLTSPSPPPLSSPPTPSGGLALGSTEGMRVGNYVLTKRIGSGGFGEVWRAEAMGGIEVAVKIIFRPLDNEESQRELQALELIKRLRHIFLLATQSYWSQEDRLLIVMELADGSLRDRLKECRKQQNQGIPIAELLNYFVEAAEALDYLHSQHVLHRDVKPDNILIMSRHAKVADFGLARALPQTQRSIMVSGSGTPAYMAPEVWRGKISEHSDQYALACTYAELRLERRLYNSRDMAEIMFDHLQRDPDLGPVPAAEQAVLLKALHKDPGQRYASCKDFAAALQEAVAEDLRQGRTLGASVNSAVANAPTLDHPSKEVKSKSTWPNDAVQPTLSKKAVPKPEPTRRIPLDGSVALEPEDVPSSGAMHGTVAGVPDTDPFASQLGSVQQLTPPRSLPKPETSQRKAVEAARAKAKWKETAPRTREPRRLFPIKAAVAVVLLVALGLGSWVVIGKLRRPPIDRSQVQEKILAKKYEEALDLVEEAGSQLLDADGLRQQVRTSWIEKSKNELNSGQYTEAERTAKGFLNRFKADSEGISVLVNVLVKAVPRDVRQSMGDGHFEEAAQRLQEPYFTSPEKADLEIKLRADWAAQGQRQYDLGQFESSIETLDALFKYFPSDRFKDLAPAALVRRRAAWERAVVDIRQKLKDKDYERAAAAVKLLGEAPEGVLTPRDALRSDIINKWLDVGNEHYKANHFEDALAVADAVRQHLENPAGASSLRERATRAIKQRDVEKAIAKHQFADAFQIIDTSKSELSEDRATALRQQVLQAVKLWANTKLADNERAEAYASLNQVPKEYQDSEIRTLQEKARPAKPLPDVAKTIDGLLHDGELQLGDDPVRARALFSRALITPGIDGYQDKRSLAHLGQARAIGRLRPLPAGWQDDVSKEVAGLSLKNAKDRAHQLALLAYAEAQRPGADTTFAWLDPLAELYSGKLVDKLDPWEQDRVTDIKFKVENLDLERLLSKKPGGAGLSPDKAAMLADKLLLFRPADAKVLWAKAYAEYLKPDLGACRKTLDSEALKKPAGALTANVKALHALVLARSTAEEDRSRAVQELGAAFGAGVPDGLRLDLCTATLDLAVRDPNNESALVTMVKTTIGSLENSGDKTALEKRIRDLETTDTRKKFERALVEAETSCKEGKAADPKTKEQLDQALVWFPKLPAADEAFQKRLDRLKALVWSWQGEGSRERSDAGKLLAALAKAQPRPSVEEFKQLYQAAAALADSGYLSYARKVIDPQALSSLPADVAGYGYYVIARDTYESSRNADEAAAMLVKLFPSGTEMPSVLQTLSAREHTARILVEASDKLRDAKNLTQPFKDKKDATKAARYLGRANLLAALPLSTAQQASLALASYYQEQPDVAQALKLAETLLAKPGPSELGFENALPLLLVKARAQESMSSPAALASYEQALDLGRKNARSISADSLYEVVLLPALTFGQNLLGKTKTPELSAKVAELYAAKGRLIEDNLNVASWKFDAKKEIAQAYSRASELDASKASYLVRKAFAQLDLGGKTDFVELLGDADKAIKLEPKSPVGHYLQAQVLHRESRLLGNDWKHQLEKLDSALAAYDKAVALGSKPPHEDLADFLTYRSSAYVDVVTYRRYVLDRAKISEYLRLARDDAERATEITSRSHPEFAYEGLGNALEDLAWIAEESKTENYSRAIDAFSDAIRLRKDLAKTWGNRGRCLAKWAIWGGADPKTLERAIEDLRRAVDLDPKSLEAAEASYWLSQIYSLRRNVALKAKQGKEAEDAYANLEKNLKRSIALYKGKSPLWRSYLIDLAAFQLSEAQLQTDAAKRTTALESCRASYDTILKEAKDPEAALLLGQTWWTIETDSQKTVEAYKRGLPDDLAKTDKSHIFLIVAYEEAMVHWPEPKKLKPKPEEQLRAAEYALRVVQAFPPDAFTQARAYGSAGIAYENALEEMELPPAKKTEYEQLAIKYLREAIKLEPDAAKHWTGWLVRCALHHRLRAASQGNDSLRKEYSVEAVKALREARKTAPETYARAIDDMINLWPQ